MNVFITVLILGFYIAVLRSVYFVCIEKELGLLEALRRMGIAKFSYHPGYFSIVLSYALLYLVYHSPKRYYMKIILLGIAILLLATKIIILFLLFFFILYFGIQIFKKYKEPVYRIVSLAGLFVSVFLFFQFPVVKSRFTRSMYEYQHTTMSTAYHHSTASRKVAYQTAWYLVKNKWLTGYGYGNANKELVRALYNQGYKTLAMSSLSGDAGMETHNQYFNNWLHFGIFGLLVLICFLLYFIIRPFRLKKYYLFSFMMLIAFNCLSDDIFEREVCTGFIVLILSLELFSSKSHREFVTDPADTMKENRFS